MTTYKYTSNNKRNSYTNKNTNITKTLPVKGLVTNWNSN